MEGRGAQTQFCQSRNYPNPQYASNLLFCSSSNSLFLFWAIRLVQQYIFLRKNSFVIHFLAVLFLLGTVLFLLPLLY